MLLDLIAIVDLTGVACVTLGMAVFGGAMPALMVWGMVADARSPRPVALRKPAERADGRQATRSAA